MKYIKLKSGGYSVISFAPGVDEGDEIAKVFGDDVDQIFDIPPQGYLDQVAAQAAAAQAARDATLSEAQAKADRMTTLRNTVADNRSAPTLPKLQAQLDAMMAVIEDLQQQ